MQVLNSHFSWNRSYQIVPDGGLRFTVYRKETHTGLYLNFKSNNPIAHKKSVAYSLFRRAKNFCLNEDKEDEDKFIFSQLKKNGYPYNFIRKCFLKVNNEETSDVQRPTESKYISMPYIQGATEKIARILKPFNIFLGTKNTNTVGSKVSFSKDRVEKDDKNSVVYKVPCRDCSSSYIGETGRELKVRIR